MAITRMDPRERLQLALQVIAGLEDGVGLHQWRALMNGPRPERGPKESWPEFVERLRWVAKKAAVEIVADALTRG